MSSAPREGSSANLLVRTGIDGIMDAVQSPLLPILVTLLVASGIVIILLWLRYETLLREHERLVKAARQKGVDQSRSTLKGQIAEQMAPLLPGFPYSPADARFLGDPIDYVVFNGLAALGDLENEAGVEIVLLEVKSGQSKLSAVQRAIATAVEEGRIRFEISRVAADGTMTTSVSRPARQRSAAGGS